MLMRVRTAALFGIDAYLVDVEVDLSSGSARDFTVVGLPDVAIRESHHRVRSVLRNCSYYLTKSVTVNLAPADRKKEGSSFDLPITMGSWARWGWCLSSPQARSPKEAAPPWPRFMM